MNENYQETVDHIVPTGYNPRKPLTKSIKMVGKEEVCKFIIVKNNKFLGKHTEFCSSILDARLMNAAEAQSIVGDNEEIKKLLSIHFVIE